MCQIQLIYRKNKLNKEDMNEFAKMMCFGSLRGHKDAWGYFTNKQSFKIDGEFDPDKKDLLSIEDKFIVGHNRYSCNILSSGFNLFNEDESCKNSIHHHPFKIEEFMLVHNGTIHNAKSLFKKYQIKTDIRTDSYSIIYLINYYFKISKLEERREKIIEAIQNTCAKLDGNFSIFLHDKKENDLYYFRDVYTHFTFCNINDSIFIGSTTKINLKYSYIDKPKKYFKPKPNAIYLIKDLSIKEIAKLKPKKNYMSLIKKEVSIEKPGIISEKINKLPGHIKKYEILEDMNLTLYSGKKDLNTLINYFKHKKMKYTKKDNKIIIGMGEII